MRCDLNVSRYHAYHIESPEFIPKYSRSDCFGSHPNFMGLIDLVTHSC